MRDRRKNISLGGGTNAESAARAALLAGSHERAL